MEELPREEPGGMEQGQGRAHTGCRAVILHESTSIF